MAEGWTDDRREKQAQRMREWGTPERRAQRGERICEWKPWERSTGPKTPWG